MHRPLLKRAHHSFSLDNPADLPSWVRRPTLSQSVTSESGVSFPDVFYLRTDEKLAEQRDIADATFYDTSPSFDPLRAINGSASIGGDRGQQEGTGSMSQVRYPPVPSFSLHPSSAIVSDSYGGRSWILILVTASSSISIHRKAPDPQTSGGGDPPPSGPLFHNAWIVNTHWIGPRILEWG